MTYQGNQSNDRVLIITGEAGTGKTWLIKELKKQLGLKPTATTWAAASLTDGETYYHADRIRADFEKNPIEKIINNSRKPRIIDEASMLSQEKLDWLLEKYPKKKFILVGDWRQLDPVEGTAINPNDYHLIELIGSHRTQDPNLINVLNAILEGNESRFKKLISARILNENISDEVFPNRIYLQHKNETKDLNRKNKTKGSIVIGIRKLIHYNNEGIETGYCDYAPDKKGNGWWHNNEFCTVKNFTSYGIELIRWNGETRIVKPEDWKFWFDGQSLTCHKVQGQTINNSDIIIEDDFVGSAEQRQKMLYVAVSRATSLDQIHFRKMPNFRGWSKLMEFKPELTGDSASPAVFDAVKNFVTRCGIMTLYSNVIINNLITKYEGYKLPDFLKKIISSLNSDFIINDTNLINLAFENHSIFKQLESGATYINRTGTFIAKNPLIKGAMKNSKENIAYPLHWYCFEFDDMSLDEQLKLAYKNKDNIFCIVYSGSKSIHCWIYNKQPIDDAETYQKVAKAINKKLFDGKACNSCIYEGQLMRRPSAIRENGKLQRPLYLGSTIDMLPDEILESNELFPENFKNCIHYNNDKSNDGLFKWFLNQRPSIGERGRKLQGVGYALKDKNQVRAVAQAWGITDKHDIENAVSKAVKIKTA